MIKINFVNDYPFEFKAKKIIKSIVKTVKKVENIKGHHSISFIVVDEQTIHNINLRYRKIDSPTDVISFAEIDSTDDRILPDEMGDIFICKERVFSQAKEYGHSPLREFAFLATHGVYHLLGYDHQTKDEEKVMFDKQEEILTILKIERK